MAETVTDLNWMKKLLSEEEVAHLALSDDGSPYVVPINYAYMDDMLVLHRAMTGRKEEGHDKAADKAIDKPVS